MSVQFLQLESLLSPGGKDNGLHLLSHVVGIQADLQFPEPCQGWLRSLCIGNERVRLAH